MVTKGCLRLVELWHCRSQERTSYLFEYDPSVLVLNYFLGKRFHPRPISLRKSLSRHGALIIVTPAIEKIRVLLLLSLVYGLDLPLLKYFPRWNSPCKWTVTFRVGRTPLRKSPYLWDSYGRREVWRLEDGSQGQLTWVDRLRFPVSLDEYVS